MRAQKAHSLIGQVYDRRNLRRAWERVRKNKGAGGVDGVTIARFEENLDRYLDVLHRQLKEGRYRPRPVKRVEIDKPGTNKKRPLGIPTIMDRVCQQALVQVLEPIFEPTFREASFGYRPGRSAHMAMRRIWRQLGQAEWIVDADISDFFGSLSHELLIDLVADRVADGKVLSLIRSMLTAGALRDGVFESAVAGTPQGGVASPLLSNIYLAVFDEKMAKAGFALTRYADDCAPRAQKEVRCRRRYRRMRCCTRDEGAGSNGLVALRGRPAGGGRKPPRGAPVKSRGAELAETARHRARQVRITKASESEPLMRRRKRIGDIETGVESLPRDEPGGCLLIGQAVSGVKVARAWSGLSCGTREPVAPTGRSASGAGVACGRSVQARTPSSGNCEGESSCAGHRGGPSRSSAEGPVIGLERRGRVVRAGLAINRGDVGGVG
ncbi:MAG: reverse transcriptase domain-containing protein [Actinomycetota bacterium]|nr:reverse transcriptase domain-containing protein [Actinomycetota bacterium]